MSKLTFNNIYEFEAKDIEKLLWKVFWSYSSELGVNDGESQKEEMLQRATRLIPEFAASVKGYELAFDYPVVHIFLTSLHLECNFLIASEVLEIMTVKGPDNDSKLARFVALLQQEGIVWQS